MVIGPKLGSGIFASGGASKHETMTIKSSQALLCALKARVTLAQGEPWVLSSDHASGLKGPR